MTDDLVRAADDLHAEVEEGPVVMADGGLGPITSLDLLAETRWPRWGEHAQRLGLRSAACSRLVRDGVVVASLQAYATDSRHFGPLDETVCDLVVPSLAVAVHGSDREQHLLPALETHTVIAQARGIVMQQYDLDDALSFDVLKRYSQYSNTKLGDVALDLSARAACPACCQMTDC